MQPEVLNCENVPFEKVSSGVNGFIHKPSHDNEATVGLLIERCITETVSQTNCQKHELLTQRYSAAVKFATLVSSSTQTNVIKESRGMNTIK